MSLSNQQILLHIGTHKTGSTSIQAFCSRNRRLLLQQGILYPESHVRWHGHHPLVWSLGLPHVHKDPSLDTASIVRAIEAELATTSARRVVLSSEDFEYLRQEAIAGLLPHIVGADVRVIVYLRSQHELLESEYSHNVASAEVRYTGTIYDFYMSQNPITRYDYDVLLNRWESALESPAMTVRPFETQQLHGENLLMDFCQSIGASWSDEYLLPAANESNARLPVPAILALRELNRLDLPAEARAEIVRVLRQTSALSNIASPADSLLTEEARAALDRQFRQSNSRVATRYLDRADGELFRSLPGSTGYRPSRAN